MVNLFKGGTELATIIHSKSLPDSQKNIKSDVEVSAKFVLAELKIAQENVEFGSATFPLPTIRR